MRFFSALAYIAVCAAAVGAGSVAGWIGKSPVATATVMQFMANTPPEEVFERRTSLTLLVLGCDEDRYYGGKQILKEQARSDMMLVTRLDFENNRITGISIPRDTVIAVSGYQRHKINAYHAIGGKPLAQQAVQELLGISIDRTVVLNFKAFQEMVDLVGGVELFVPKRMKYTDRRGGLFIDLEPGRQRLNGYDAMGFVRFRHNDSDFERQKRQKDFMLAFKDSVMGRPEQLTSVATKAVDVMGGALSPREVAALGLFARRVGSDNIRMGMIPVVEAGGTNLRVDSDKLRDVLREFHFLGAHSTAYGINR